jgi:hypothetical protein
VIVFISVSCGEDNDEFNLSRSSQAEGVVIAPIEENSMDATVALHSIYISADSEGEHAGTALYIPEGAYPEINLQGVTFLLSEGDLDLYEFEDDFNESFETELTIQDVFAKVKVSTNIVESPREYLSLMFELPESVDENDYVNLAVTYKSFDKPYESSQTRVEGLFPFSSRKVKIVDSKVVVKIYLYGQYSLVLTEEALVKEYISRVLYTP